MVLADTPCLLDATTMAWAGAPTKGGQPDESTKSNEWRHARRRLTPQQCTAVDLLVSGKTLTETAAALGVGRPAVSDWVNHSSRLSGGLE